MSTTPQGSETVTDTRGAGPVAPTTWLRTPITIAVERWVLVAAGFGALLLLLLALD